MEEGDKTLARGIHDDGIIKEKSNNNVVIRERQKEKEKETKMSSDHQVVVRSRWSPKPEQILILESIFNSGMFNPPKEETVRIRKLLEKFGSVGDANVFYWFQNRRSRSRRRHRQIMSMQHQQFQHQQLHDAMVTPSSSDDLHGNNSNSYYNNGATNHHHHHLFSLHQIPETIEPSTSSSSSSLPCPPSFHFHSPAGVMTVFINGVATEVPKGAIEVKGMVGEDVVLVHSSGLAIPTNEFGILLQTLHPGESYFLVPRPVFKFN